MGVLNGLAGRARVGAPAGDPGLFDGRAAAGAGLAGPGKDLELVLVLAGLAEGVVVGIEGGAP